MVTSLPYPLPANERQRLAALRNAGILDTPAEQEYDDLVALAAEICGAPMASITFVDETRQWFKARLGLADPETPRTLSFCAHAIAAPAEDLLSCRTRPATPASKTTPMSPVRRTSGSMPARRS